MKTQILLYSFLLINSVFVSNAHGTIIIRHQLMPEDVSELNILGNALGVAGKPGITGWPVSAELNTYITGVNFIVKDTLKTMEGKDEIWTIRHKVKEINLASQNLSGTLPNLSFSDLEIFNLGFNQISGNIPVLYFPKCKEIVLNRNQFTGQLPKFDLPELTYIGFISNKLTGTIPNINLPKLQTLFLGDNQFEGEIPNFNLPALKYLYLTKNKLTGNIPNFILPALQDLDIEENQLTGPIPLFNFPNAWNIRLTDNQLTGPVPNFNMSKLSNLALGQNKLTGKIPKLNLPNLILLNLKENQLEGEFDNSGLPILIDLYIQKNMITGIPHLKAKSPNLEIVDVSGCNLKFEHIEPNMDIKNFKYSGQQRIETSQSQSGTLITLSVKDSAPHNQYKWRKIKDGVSNIVPDAVSDKLVITFEPGVAYFCSITNTNVPGLTINSKTININSCINFGLFAFCLESGSWEKKENNTASASGKIYINDLAVFEGSLTLDTLNLAMQANGKLYVQNIPLPGGGTGNFLLSQGEHNLKLLGQDGVITNFLNSNLEKTASIFGATLKIDSLQFVRKQQNWGISVSCSVIIPGLSKACDVYSPGTEIALKNFTITTAGYSFDGLNVDDLGLFKEDYCLNNLTYEYDRENDVVTGGMEISLPFLANSLGGGFKLEKGKLDSCAWSVEGGSDAQIKGIPIFGTFGVKGFYGHIAGLNKPYKPFEINTIDIQMGGIFSDVTSDNLYRFTAEGRIVWPTLFEYAGTGQFMKPPDETKLPYQLAGSIQGKAEIPLNKVYADFTGNFGTLDEETYLMAVKGGYTAIYHDNQAAEISTKFSGEISLPKLTNGFPYNWIETFLKFPVKIGTTNAVFPENQYVLHGLLYFYPFPGHLYQLAYKLDATKKLYEYGYITFPSVTERQIFIAIEEKSGKKQSEVTKTFVVPENTEFVVIEVNSPGKTPVSKLKTPAGKEYSESAANENILLSKAENGKESFWSVFSPATGNWSLTLENPASTDTVITYLQQKKTNFKFAVKQTGNNIQLTWDVAQLDSDQIVNVMFDNDLEGYDGFRVASVNALNGELSFTLDEEYTNCSYYIYAQLVDKNFIVESYAEKAIDNHLNSLAPPANFISEFNPENGEFEFKWELNPLPAIEGYILSITNESGKDSVFAILNKSAKTVSLFIENFETKTAKIESFSNDWKIGCPSASVELLTNAEDFSLPVETATKLKVYPNPTNGYCTIRYFVPRDSRCEITLLDINGRKVAQPVAEFQPKGIHLVEYQYKNLPNGIYFVRYSNNFESVTVKSVFSK